MKKKRGRVPLPFGEGTYKSIVIRVRKDMYDFLRGRAEQAEGSMGGEAKKIIRREMSK